MKPHALLVLCLALCLPVAAEATSAADACFQRRPEPDSVRALRFTAHDAQGGKTVLVLRLYGRRNAEGLGQLLLRVEQPTSLQGTSLLVLQRPDADSDIYLASPAQPAPRPIQGAERTGGMFGTDFSYEDLERVQHGWRPAAAGIAELPAAQVADRPAYVFEIRPRGSVWERIEFSLDQERCLPLLIRFFEAGKKLPSKEFTTEPRSHVKHGDLWVAHSAIMRDRVKHTTTHLMVDSHAQEPVPSDQFSVEGLERAVGGGAKASP
jgi:hypothetical protein